MLGDRVELEQRVDLPLPALRLLGDDAECGELGPEARLVAADPQALRRPVAEARGPRRSARAATAAAARAARSARRPGAASATRRCASAVNTGANGSSRPSTVIVTPRSNQSRSPSSSSGRDRDLERLADIAVIRRFAGHLDGEPWQRGEPRQLLGRQVQAVEAGERHGRMRGPSGVVEKPEPPEAGVGDLGGGEDGVARRRGRETRARPPRAGSGGASPRRCRPTPRRPRRGGRRRRLRAARARAPRSRVARRSRRKR